MILLRLFILLIVIIAGLSSCWHIDKPADRVGQNLSQQDFSQSGIVSNVLIMPQEIPLISIEQSYRSNDLLNSSNNPFIVVNEIANKRVDSWVNRPSEVKSPLAFKPKIPKSLAPSLLKKGEFETTQNFQKRILYQEQERINKVNIIDKKYQDDIDKYNNLVRGYNHSIANERNKREQTRIKKYWEFVDKTLVDVLGNPTLKIYQYDADSQVFYATLGSVKSNLNQWIKIYVPLNVAKIFKNSAKNAAPVLSFDKNINEQLVISKVSIDVNASKYAATLIKKPNFSNTGSHIVRSKEINTLENYISVN